MEWIAMEEIGNKAKKILNCFSGHFFEKQMWLGGFLS